MVKSNVINFLDSLNFNKETKYLLAVSGGVDSMVLLDVMSGQYNIHVAHINHGMRGKESDGDEQLVREICSEKGIPYHTLMLPNELKTVGNFQSTARTFRYEYFNKLLNDHDIEVILTAHHKDDSIETTLFNFLRGTGIEGLQGIPQNNASLKVIRPMIGISKSEIYDYAKSLNIKYREDSSNEKDTYSRNHLRNHLIPFIDKEYGLKGIHNTILYTQDYFKQYSMLLDHFLSPIKHRDFLEIGLKKLKTIENPSLALFHFAKDFGFNLDQCANLLHDESGRRIRIDNQIYEMIKDRSSILIRKIEKQDFLSIEIFNEGVYKIGKHSINVQLINENEPNTDPQKGLILFFNVPPFPLTFRSRKAGDSFKPNGMNGQSKTIKKYIIDSKLSTEEIEHLFIIEKYNSIIGVFPFRVSQGYKLNKESSIHLSLTLI
jgi:tRNA(Ile)-lysidine synthase